MDSEPEESGTPSGLYVVAVGSLSRGMVLYGPFTNQAAHEFPEEVNEQWQIGSENIESVELRHSPRERR